MVEVPCPNKGCTELVVKRDLGKHLQQCEYRTMNCQWCKQDIYYNQRQVGNVAEYIAIDLILNSFTIQEHENECAFIPVECPNKCHESILRKQVST